jgi:hypothetical protein
MRETESTRNDHRLTPRLDAAVAVLRDELPVSDLWRRRLLHEIEHAGSPRAIRRWSIRPSVAIAACAACLLVGASTSLMIFGRDPAPAVAPSVSTVRFSFAAPNAAQVFVVGDFNAWNPRALPMHRSSNGAVWIVDVPLPAGRYAYSFIVDGSLARDPHAPQAADDDFGSANSVVLVRGS